MIFASDLDWLAFIFGSIILAFSTELSFDWEFLLSAVVDLDGSVEILLSSISAVPHISYPISLFSHPTLDVIVKSIPMSHQIQEVSQSSRVSVNVTFCHLGPSLSPVSPLLWGLSTIEASFLNALAGRPCYASVSLFGGPSLSIIPWSINCLHSYTVSFH